MTGGDIVLSMVHGSFVEVCVVGFFYGKGSKDDFLQNKKDLDESEFETNAVPVHVQVERISQG